MDIELIRGDTYQLKFQRKLTDDTVITQKPDEMYMTFKRNYNEIDYVLQKRLSRDEIIFNEDDNYYYVTIEPEDTNDLDYGSYVFDIETKVGKVVKTITLGKLKIKKEVTFAENEV